MSETAQIILALGAALAVILFALNGPLATVLNRGSSQRLPVTQVRLTRREWWLLAVACVSAASGIIALLNRLL